MRKEQPNADDETGACSICGRRYQNWGHNAQPVNDGRCCDHCNVAVVVPKRLRSGPAKNFLAGRRTKQNLFVCHDQVTGCSIREPLLWPGRSFSL